MRRIALWTSIFLGVALPVAVAADAWPPAKAPVIPEADGYAVIPGAAVPPDASLTYRAIFDSNQGADAPDHLVPGLNMAGSELNAFGVAGVPLKSAKFVVVFHGRAMDGILDEAHYRAKFGVANPNLPVISKMKALGVEFYVCGQNL
ncbi:MAG: hypothetical protein HY049_17785, partial [Acidobacteria bacterium]|nr:hypothetical protein [Acidobacteriota bacterium]